MLGAVQALVTQWWTKTINKELQCIVNRQSLEQGAGQPVRGAGRSFLQIRLLHGQVVKDLSIHGFWYPLEVLESIAYRKGWLYGDENLHKKWRARSRERKLIWLS